MGETLQNENFRTQLNLLTIDELDNESQESFLNDKQGSKDIIKSDVASADEIEFTTNDDALEKPFKSAGAAAIFVETLQNETFRSSLNLLTMDENEMDNEGQESFLNDRQGTEESEIESHVKVHNDN